MRERVGKATQECLIPTPILPNFRYQVEIQVPGRDTVTTMTNQNMGSLPVIGWWAYGHYCFQAQ